MKFTCEREIIASAATVALRATSPKSPIPALEGLRIEAFADGTIRITGYDLKTGIIVNLTGEVAEEGAIVLGARLFCEIIRKLPGSVVSLSVRDSGKAVIESGDSRFEIMVTPAFDYPELPETSGDDGFTVDSALLADILGETNYAHSPNESNPVYDSSLFEIKGGELTVVAHDKYRVALRRETLPDGTPDLSFVAPGAALGEAERIAASEDGDVDIIVSEKHVIFRMPSVILISRRLEIEYTNYRKILPEETTFTAKVVRRELVDAIERVSLIISDKVRNPLVCTLEDDAMTLEAVSAYGQARDVVSASGDLPRLEIRFNSRYLLDALRAASGDETALRFVTAESRSPLVVSPPDGGGKFAHLVLPVRGPSGDGN